VRLIMTRVPIHVLLCSQHREEITSLVAERHRRMAAALGIDLV
jgi:hypothetical protein